MYQNLYQEFISANPEVIHMAAHSHHYWPDVVKSAVLESYEDSRKLTDLKWEKILGEVVPQSQRFIANTLNLSHPEQIAFAPNTHELLSRLLSCYDPAKELRILTTDSEFHSASRQFKRLEELENVQIKYVSAQEEDFSKNFLEEIKTELYDFIFVSQVFFNTGKLLKTSELEAFVNAKPEKTIFCLDGYHGFCAIPTDLSKLEDKIFYLGGSYKYAQAGEGMCFMTVPKSCALRPLNTGWFASFDTLEKAQDRVAYANDGQRFAGSTRDFTAHYRFNAVWKNFESMGITIDTIHQYIQKLQSAFLDSCSLKERIINADLSRQGHFLVVKTDSNEQSSSLYTQLRESGILTDFRGQFLRFGFGLYLTEDQARKAGKVLSSLNLN